MKEIWKPIPGYKNYYASNLGNIMTTFNGNHIKRQCKCRKYFVVGVSYGHNKNRIKYVHRLVYAAFHPEEDITELQIDHIDTNTENNNINNLRAVTQKENLNNPLTLQHLRDGSIKRKVKFVNDKTNTIYESISEMSRVCDIPRSTIHAMIHRGIVVYSN